MPPCCSRKVVGGVEYLLKMEGDTSAYNCLSNCIFEKSTEPGSVYCFTWGNLEVECSGESTEISTTEQEMNIPDFPLEFSDDLLLALVQEISSTEEDTSCSLQPGTMVPSIDLLHFNKFCFSWLNGYKLSGFRLFSKSS